MRKRELWVSKSQKRKRRKGDRGMVDLMRIMHHFFRNLPEWIGEMEDPRHLSYVTYTQNDLMYMGILKNMCVVKNHA